MKVLVTGTTGFIGQHVLDALTRQNHEIFSLERYVTGRDAMGSRRQGKSVFCDLRDHFAVRRTVREVQPDAVVHLAAISPVAYSYEHFNEVLDANLGGTINLAEACLREIPHFRQFLFASTSETYGNGPVPKSEATEQRPNSPYAVSKLAAEKYLFYMRDAYGFPVTVLRPFNTYGRKDNVHFVVERIVVQMLNGGSLELGDPEPIRDLLYVDDHVNAYLSCLGNERAIFEVFNFCTGRGISVGRLVDLLRDITGFRGDVFWNTIPQRPLDINTLIGDNSKAERILGWRPTVRLEDGLRVTVEYWSQRLPPPTRGRIALFPEVTRP